jgi:hypothetical protein
MDVYISTFASLINTMRIKTMLNLNVKGERKYAFILLCKTVVFGDERGCQVVAFKFEESGKSCGCSTAG